MPRFASVVPLVSARRSRGHTRTSGTASRRAPSSCSVRRGARRGVVVGLEDEAPPEVEPVAVEKVVGAVPALLVDLALWLADYYGSTPARALALVAPPRGPPCRGAPQAPRGLRARGADGSATAGARGRRIAAALAGGGPDLLLHGATGAARRRSTSEPARRRSSGGSARSCSCRRSR